MMKIMGAILVVVGCSGVGFAKCRAHRHLERCLQQLLKSLEWMKWELGYRMPPLSELCRGAARSGSGTVATVFARLSEELERQVLPDAYACTVVAVDCVSALPPLLRTHFLTLGNGLGKFGLEGQLGELEAEISLCKRDLEEVTRNCRLRLRDYRTFAVCAGAAIAILFL